MAKDTGLNTKTMLVHASSFVIFMVTVALVMVGTVIYSFKPDNKFANLFYSITLFFNYLGSFISQTLLCIIFWDLGKVQVTDHSQSHDSIQVAEFDEEAEVQARIWNQF